MSVEAASIRKKAKQSCNNVPYCSLYWRKKKTLGTSSATRKDGKLLLLIYLALLSQSAADVITDGKTLGWKCIYSYVLFLQ